MQIKNLVDEDFVNYKKPSMFVIFPHCSFKCDKDCGQHVCQNRELAKEKNQNIDVRDIVLRYLSNRITKALVCGGLEPFDSFDSLLSLVTTMRMHSTDDIVIYTGYNKEEIINQVHILGQFNNIIIKGPSTPLQDEKEALLKYESNKPTYIMCGMIRNDYIKYLNEKHILPRNADDKGYKLINNTKELLFYYHAIKDNVVYALHANTSDAKYFCGSQTDFGKTAIIKLEDWTADIVKSELVSAEKLKERLYQNCEYKLENPKADFYYLVTLNNVKWHGNEIAGTVYKAYENIGNMAASPYSPKIIEVKKTV